MGIEKCQNTSVDMNPYIFTILFNKKERKEKFFDYLKNFIHIFIYLLQVIFQNTQVQIGINNQN